MKRTAARHLFAAGALLCIVGLVGSSAAASTAPGFHGRVSDPEGKPLAGAMVSARHRELARTTSVYADAQGRYALPELPGGVYDLRARQFGFEDGIERAVAATGQAIDFRLAVETDGYERMSALPANRWLALALTSFPDAQMREEFTRQCTYCHQQGSWATRVDRTPEQWEKIFSLMARMGGVLSSETRAALPGVLNAAYEHPAALGRLEEQLRSHPLASPAGMPAVIDEWEVGDRASVQHDIVVHPSGHVYSVDTTKDYVHRLDPRTGERKSFKIPDGGLPLGGIFDATSNVLPPNADAHVGPHSLQVAPDGKLWVTLCLGNKIAVLDATAESWTLIDQQTGIYPHTLRFDQKGRAWYSLAVSNHVAMIDPSTGEQRTIRLPSRTWAQSIAALVAPLAIRLGGWLPTPETAPDGAPVAVPYGVDIAPDGGVWFSQLNARRIGRVDPETGSYEVIDTPFPAPRRLRFDSQGKLWIPSFSGGLLARFDPATRKFDTWPLPTSPPGTETPYALNVDRKTDTVWICGTGSDTLIRFDPRSEQFTVFPLPTRVTFTREIDFDDQGGVWTSNSNTPGWQIESANPQIIRLLEGGAPHARS